MVGMSWGLPGEWRLASLHPDEPINWMVTRNSGDFTPNFYNYGTLFFTIHHAAQAVLHLLGLGAPDLNSATVAGLAQEVWLGRWLSALFGAGTALATFLFLFRRTSWLAAVLAGAVVAVAPGFVVHSRFMTVDVMATFFVILALIYAAEAQNQTRWQPYIACAVFAGLAAGSKYNGVLAVLGLIPALMLLPTWKERAIRASQCLGTTVAVFVACVPGVILEPGAFWRDVNYEMWHVATGHGMVFAGTGPGWTFHWANLFAALGLGLTLLGLVGLGRLTRNRELWIAPFVIFFVVYFILIARAEVKFMRYVLPLIPMLAIGFGWLMSRFHEHSDRRWKLAFGVGLLALGGMDRGGVLGAIQSTAFMAGQDPREQAAVYLRESGGSVGLVADPWFYTPSLYPEAPWPRSVPFPAREEARLAQTRPQVLRYIPSDPNARVDWDVRLIREQSPDAIVFSSFELEGYTRLMNQSDISDPADRAAVERFREFRKVLLDEYGLARTFGGGMVEIHDMLYIRPTVQVWKRKNSSATPSTPTSTTSRRSEESATPPE